MGIQNRGRRSKNNGFPDGGRIFRLHFFVFLPDLSSEKQVVSGTRFCLLLCTRALGLVQGLDHETPPKNQRER